MRRLLALCCLATLAIAACSDDGDGGSSGDGGNGGNGGTGEVTTQGPTTTFMPDCAPMPTVADISAAVGVPLGDGEVVESGTCQYLGLNDQSQVVTLGYFTDPGDQAAFMDLQASLGAATPIDNPALPGAVVGLDGSVYINSNGTLLSVMTMVTGGTAVEQADLSIAVLTRWVQL